MDYFHHIGGNSSIDPKLYDFMVQKKYPMKTLKAPNGDESYVIFVFDIYESDPLWPQIKEIISEYDPKYDSVVNIIDTHFTEAELRNARWSWIGATFEQGDPMPRFKWIREGLTFQLECQECWIYRQITPFRISKEPRWGKNMFLRLVSVMEILTRPEVIDVFHQQGFTGFEDWEVLIHKSGLPAQTVRQLIFKEVCPVEVENKAQLIEMKCPACGRVRYKPHMRGTFQYKAADLEPIETDFMLMQERIGNGGVNWHEILVSNRVVQFILDQKWQGIRFKAIKLV